MADLGFGFLAALFGRDVLAGKCAMVFIGIAAFFMQEIARVGGFVI